MNVSRLISLFMLALACIMAGIGPAHAGKAVRHQRVIFAVTEADPHIWNEVFGNFRNIQRALGPKNVDIEMVVYADAIGMLRDDSEVANKVEDAIAEGVRIVACVNTMTAQKIDRKDMLPKIGYVQAGIVELIQKQSEGWAYIRP